MKKRIIAMMLGLCMVALLAGCGKEEKKETEEKLDFSNTKVGESGELSNDYVKITQYKGLQVEIIEPEAVTDEAVEESIKSDIESEWQTVGIKDRAAKDGDTVVIDFVGKKDGVAFQGGTSNDYFLTLGSKTFIDGFEAGIVGKKPGETFDLNLTFPENYGSTDLAGQAVVFTVTFDAILPEFSADLVSKLSKTATTVDEYKAEVKANLEKNNQEAAEEQMKQNLLAKLTEQCEVIKYPEKELKKYTKLNKKTNESYFEQYAQQNGMTTEQLEAASGMTAEEMFKNSYGLSYEEMAQQQLKLELSLETLVAAEKLEYTDEEYQEQLQKLADKVGYPSTEEYEKAYEDLYGEGSFRYEVLQQIVVDFLWGNCEKVEAQATESTETATE